MGEKPKPIEGLRRGHEVVNLNFPLDGIYGIWKCPDCGKRILHSYFALTEVGNPICDGCDVEMELESPIAHAVRRRVRGQDVLRELGKWARDHRTPREVAHARKKKQQA